MKNTFKGLLLGAALVCGLGVTSCRNDEADMKFNPSAEKIHVSVDAFIASDNTRTALTQGTGEEKNILKFSWALGDKIEVVTSEGVYLGPLKITKVNETDPRKCSFSGDITAPEGAATLRFYYIGNKDLSTSLDPEIGYIAQDINLPFGVQDGLAESLAANDILVASHDYEKVVAGNLGFINFDRYFSYAYFTLKMKEGEEYRDIDVDGAVKITANEGCDFYNNVTLKFGKEMDGFERATSYDGITGMRVGSNTNTFFMTLIPSDSFGLHFECTTTDGKTFAGDKGGKLIRSDKFYSDNGEPIIIEMEKVSWTVKWMNGYSTDPIKSEEVTDPDNIAADLYPADPTRDGWKFISWSVERNDDNKEVVITANWEKLPDPAPENPVITPGFDHGDWNE